MSLPDGLVQSLSQKLTLHRTVELANFSVLKILLDGYNST